VRYHDAFSPEGTNVDFVQVKGPQSVLVRTYERGVEGETHACGTGAVASAIVANLKALAYPPIEVQTWGGERLKVYFRVAQDLKVKDVYLEGRAVLVYSGITEEVFLE